MDKTLINDIKRNFNQVINFTKTNRDYFIHGDFHPVNCVLDENGEIILIDWQNCQLGRRDEIAYFIGIGKDWGIDIYEDEMKKHYCERLTHYTGKTFTMSDLNKEYHMSTVFHNYFYAANYLQDSEASRVQFVFDTTVASYKWLLLNKCI